MTQGSDGFFITTAIDRDIFCASEIRVNDSKSWWSVYATCFRFKLDLNIRSLLQHHVQLNISIVVNHSSFYFYLLFVEFSFLFYFFFLLRSSQNCFHFSENFCRLMLGQFFCSNVFRYVRIFSACCIFIFFLFFVAHCLHFALGQSPLFAPVLCPKWIESLQSSSSASQPAS